MASEYGWALKDILEEVYFDELFIMVDKINARNLTEYRMQLAIVQNPHVKDPKDLWRVFDAEERKMKALEQTARSDAFDPVGFENFKAVMRQNKQFVVKS